VFLCRFANNDFLNDAFLLADNRLLFRLSNLDYNVILFIAGADRPIYRTSINRYLHSVVAPVVRPASQ
jgi:hypothetical protein